MVYSAKDKLLVEAFEAESIKNSDYWSDKSLEKLRLNIKRHYKTVQGYTCCYCRRVFMVKHGRAWEAEHIVPRKSHAHFMFTPLNLALACPDCNGKKGAEQTLININQTIYPTNGDAFHIVHPHFDIYEVHIEKGEFTYVRRTDKGEWTIKECGLTRFAEMKIGWPEPVNDERFEDEVDQVFAGSGTAATDIGAKLSSAMAIKSST